MKNLRELRKAYKELGEKIEAIENEDLSVDLRSFPDFSMSVPNYSSLVLFASSRYDYKAILLDDEFDWKIVKGEYLIPTKKPKQ